MPAAGKGERFKKNGYKASKPLIKISEKYMFQMALKCFPKTNSQTIVLQKDIYQNINRKNNYPINFLPVNGFTKGQAETCMMVINNNNPNNPIVIISCDMGIMLKDEQIEKLNQKNNVDIYVFVSKIDLASKLNTKQLSWISLNKDKSINQIIIKPVKKPFNYNHYLLGAFQFKSESTYKQLFNLMKNQNFTINNEYYIDNMIKIALEKKLKCEPLFIEYFFNWGTPSDLETYNYWEKCFNTWTLHDFKIKTFK